MKKFFSLSAGIAVGLLVFMILGYAYKTFFSSSTTTTTAPLARQLSGNDFGNFGSGAGNPGMMRSGGMMGGSGAMRGTGYMPRTTGGILSAEEVLQQDAPQQ